MLKKKKKAVTKSQVRFLWNDFGCSSWPLRALGFCIFEPGPQACFDVLSPNIFAKKCGFFGGFFCFCFVSFLVLVVGAGFCCLHKNSYCGSVYIFFMSCLFKLKGCL